MKKQKVMPLCILAACLLLSLGVRGQQSLTAAGTSAADASGNKMLYAVGEVAVQHVATAGNILDEGLIAPYIVESLSIPGVEGLGMEIAVFPNPVTDRLTVQASASVSTLRCRLFDMHGRQLSTVTMNDGTAHIECSSLPAGVYMLRVDDGTERASSYRIVKNK